jgi:hypothetical protein
VSLSPEFEAANKRRLELLEKQFAGFTPEEAVRRFDEHPEWRAECERRYRKNLTDEERSELARLTDFVDAALSKAYPLPFGLLEELERKAGIKKDEKKE